jgi:hypothetical protein
VAVAPRYVLLISGAVLVLGVSLYLFFEVRARPAQAHGAERAAAHGADEPAKAVGEDGARPSAVTPARTPPASGEAAGPRPGAGAGSVVREPPRGPDGAPQDPAPYKIDAAMAEANKAYDRGELDEAKTLAQRVLKSWPGNVRMLRIVVSASCISGDAAEAQAAYAQLPNPDREQMRTRCARYGFTFTEPP